MTSCFPVDMPLRVAPRFLVALLLSAGPLPLDAQLSPVVSYLPLIPDLNLHCRRLQREALAHFLSVSCKCEFGSLMERDFHQIQPILHRLGTSIHRRSEDDRAGRTHPTF